MVKRAKVAFNTLVKEETLAGIKARAEAAGCSQGAIIDALWEGGRFREAGLTREDIHEVLREFAAERAAMKGKTPARSNEGFESPLPAQAGPLGDPASIPGVHRGGPLLKPGERKKAGKEQK